VALREIDKGVTDEILLHPHHIITNDELVVYQSVINEKGKNYLIRIFVNLQKQQPLVVTVYKTSKIEKYLK